MPIGARQLLSPLIDTAVDYHGDLVRNIKTIREGQDLFDDLSQDRTDWAVAIAAYKSALAGP